MESACALICLMHGINSVYHDLSNDFWGEFKGFSPIPYKFIYLTFHCNFIHMVFGLVWLLEIYVPGSVPMVHTIVHFVAGLGFFVGFNYYVLIHFDRNLREEVKKTALIGDLVLYGREISPPVFWRVMNWVHAPLIPMSGLFLVTMDRTTTAAAIADASTTWMLVCGYGLFYACIVQLIFRWHACWVYPFMAKFTHSWQHIAFYTFSFGFMGLLSLSYRDIIFRDPKYDLLGVGIELDMVVRLSVGLLVLLTTAGLLVATEEEEEKEEIKKTR